MTRRWADQVLSFSACRLTAIGFRDLLQSSPLLKSIIIRDGAVKTSSLVTAFSDPTPPAPAPLPDLKSLVLTQFEDANYLNNTLRLFTAPNLYELTLAELCLDEDEELVDFTSTFEFLASRHDMLGHLECLTIDLVYCHYSEDTVKSFYFASPNLRRIRVAHNDNENSALGIHDSDVFLLALRPTSQEVPCPRLEEMKVSGIQNSIVYEVARNRAEVGKPLKRVIHASTDNIGGPYVLAMSVVGVEVWEEGEEGEVDGDDEESDSE